MRKRTVVRWKRTVKNDSEPQAATAQDGVEISIMGGWRNRAERRFVLFFSCYVVIITLSCYQQNSLKIGVKTADFPLFAGKGVPNG
jgi:hypothetical protein